MKPIKLYKRRNFIKFRHVFLKHNSFSRRLVLGSSETTRGAPFPYFSKKKTSVFFDFRDFYNNAPLHIKKNLNPEFLEWFIGFAEGDGSFFIKNEKNKKKRLIFEICQKDPQIVFRIKKFLGFGRVRSWARTNPDTQKTQVYWVYTIDTQENVKRIISLFNGNLILTKRKVQFEKWLRLAFRLKCLPKPFQKKNLSYLRKVSLQTAWLAGFIDAEGCFYAKFSKDTKKPNSKPVLKQKFHLTQKNQFNEIKVLEQIKNLFESKANIRPIFSSGKKKRKHNKTDFFRIEISSLHSHQLMIKYLQKFKLKSNKYICFHRWFRVVKARENNLHLSMLNIPKLERLCKAINKKFINTEFINKESL